MINQLKDHVNDLGDATIVVPMIKEYLDVSVKNDDMLVRVATIIQRMLNSAPGKDDFDMSLEELQSLIQEDPKKE
mgnify:FL=1